MPLVWELNLIFPFVLDVQVENLKYLEDFWIKKFNKTPSTFVTVIFCTNFFGISTVYGITSKSSGTNISGLSSYIDKFIDLSGYNLWKSHIETITPSKLKPVPFLQFSQFFKSWRTG